jgi:EAL domain-containing protein (putative c-di-GMP-specific phosphodiesterase class I)/ActR/RegA family two-component response regulator
MVTLMNPAVARADEVSDPPGIPGFPGSKPRAGRGAGPISVLLADDDSAIRDVLKALIASEPALELTDAVGTAAAAIEAARRRPPTVALVDVRMPGGGAMATRGIKQCSPDTRVLALSVHEDRVHVLEMLEAGADGYLVKGSSIDAIAAGITRAAAGLGSLSAEVTREVLDELSEHLRTRRLSHENARSREERVRRALTGGVLGMVFQPICSLAGETVGAEALARFACEPRQGPEAWFAEADEAGLRLELELAAAQAALAALPHLPEPLYLTINVAPTTLADAAFPQLLEQADATRIVIEITEHAPIDDYEDMRRTLAHLRALGCRVAIDDAGAGFASLRHILRLEPDFIKLDRALIDEIESDASMQALATSLIVFGEKIGAIVVAEGIERSAQVEMLTSLGVGYGQGYFFARPSPLPVPLRCSGAFAQPGPPARRAA